MAVFYERWGTVPAAVVNSHDEIGECCSDAGAGAGAPSGPLAVDAFRYSLRCTSSCDGCDEERGTHCYLDWKIADSVGC